MISPMYLFLLQSAPLILTNIPGNHSITNNQVQIAPVHRQNNVNLNQIVATNNTCGNAFLSPEPVSLPTIKGEYHLHL